MKKVIENVIPYPIDCEVHLASVFASLLTSIKKDIPKGMAICKNSYRKSGNVGEPCTRCGNCRGWTIKEREYGALANEYAFVSGQALLQFDMTDKNPNYESEMLERIGDTVDFMCRYAGYTYKPYKPEAGKTNIFNEITLSIDNGIPVLLEYKIKNRCLLVTGYGDNMGLYGYDGGGYTAYYPKMEPVPDYYEDKLFFATNWYEAMERAVILDKKCKPTVTINNVISRNVLIMKPIFDENYYDKAADYILNNDNFKDEADNLSIQARLISDFIGVPIGGRSIISWFLFNQLDNGCEEKYREMFSRIAGCCCDLHEICWVAWRGVGTNEGDKKQLIIARLSDPMYRKMLAGVIKLVGMKDWHIFEGLNELNKIN